MRKEHCVITKVYRFSSGHRLHNAKFTEEENWKIFGKCTNAKGHGHDYYIEVMIKGDIDPETGMVIHLNDLDGAVSDIIEELDHKRLDLEIPFFKENRPSGELIVKYIWLGLKPKMDEMNNAELYHLKLWETPNNYFEYFEHRER